MYTPKPIDLNYMNMNTLDNHFKKVLESIAEHVHDVWASQRIKDGWVYGSELSSKLKHHPCLIPYNELPEEEKEVDRNTVMESIKLLKHFGYMVTDVFPGL